MIRLPTLYAFFDIYDNLIISEAKDFPKNECCNRACSPADFQPFGKCDNGRCYDQEIDVRLIAILNPKKLD